MREVITGDAVVVDLPVARPASRGLAFAIDVVVLGIAFTILVFALAAAGLFTSDGALAAAVALVLFVGVFVGVPVTVETLTRGRSLGKMALGLRVVRDDGGPIRFRHALVRGLTGLIADFGILSSFTGAIALVSSLASLRGQRLGDRLAGTVVVRDRVPGTAVSTISMPPPLAAWAASLALSQLRDDLALAARQFVVRAPALDPGVRQAMGRSLAAEVAAVVSPPPPPGTPPEMFLAAVLAERSRRASAQLAVAQPHPSAPATGAWSGSAQNPWSPTAQGSAGAPTQGSWSVPAQYPGTAQNPAHGPMQDPRSAVAQPPGTESPWQRPGFAEVPPAAAPQPAPPPPAPPPPDGFALPG